MIRDLGLKTIGTTENLPIINVAHYECYLKITLSKEASTKRLWLFEFIVTATAERNTLILKTLCSGLKNKSLSIL